MKYSPVFDRLKEMKPFNYALFIGFLLMVTTTHAQVNKKYLSGAVPEVNGKVVFNKSFDLPGLQQPEIYNRALAWAKSAYDNKGMNILAYTDSEKFVLSCKGNEELIFHDKALSLDKSDISYQLNIYCENALCQVEIKSISYRYASATENKFDTYKAETWITDKEAVNKDKLYKANGKFRIKTIDLVNDIYHNLAGALRSAAENDLVSPLKSHKKIASNKIPGSIINLLTNDWMLITAGNDTKSNVMTASWGGLGVLWQKPVAFCFIHPKRYTHQLMKENDYYTLSFYTETYREVLQYCGSHSGQTTDKIQGSGLTPITLPSGAKSFEEAWLILECKKVLELPITPEAIIDLEAKKQWSNQAHEIFAGEIIGVWVK